MYLFYFILLKNVIFFNPFIATFNVTEHLQNKFYHRLCCGGRSTTCLFFPFYEVNEK